MVITYQFRIKDSNKREHLKQLAGKVNFVWNYLNETASFAWNRDHKWLSEFDLNRLLSGASKEVEILQSCMCSISKEYAKSRKQTKRSKLNWRSSKRSLGWIPFKNVGIKINNDSFVFMEKKYRFWKSREIKGVIKTGSFTENAKGEWFINLNCEIEKPEQTASTESVGIDLGLKTLATMSDGTKIENPKTLSKYADKLAMAQRAKKKKLVKAIHTKIKNIRKDFHHKQSTALVKKYKVIKVGDVSSSKLVKTKMAKSTLDAGWAMLKTMLEYKAKMLGVDFEVVKESYSSVTCSVCLKRTGPSGLSALGVRTWSCLCGVSHDRDVNAARNILFGLGR